MTQRYTFSTYVGYDKPYDEDPTNYASLYLGDLHRDVNGDLWKIELCGGSDNSGSSVTVANYNSILNLFSEALGRAVWPYYGGYSTYGIVYKPEALTEDERGYLEDILAQLEDYPLIDEEECSKVESQTENDAWDGGLDWDVARRIEKLFGGEGYNVEILIWSQDEKERLRYFFEEMMERKNEYYENETGNQVYVDIDRVLPDLMAILERPEFVIVDKEFTND